MPGRGSFKAGAPRAWHVSWFVDRRQDPHRQGGFAASLDQLDHRVQVEPLVPRRLLGQDVGKTGGAQLIAPPPKDSRVMRRRPSRERLDPGAHTMSVSAPAAFLTGGKTSRSGATSLWALH
jgi:hypothetical protein